MKLLFILFPFLLFGQVYNVTQTGVTQSMIRGDLTVLSWTVPGDYSADSLEMKVKSSASPTGDILIMKATNGDGITASYSSNTTVLCTMYVYDTQAFTAAGYYYDVYSETDSVTLVIGLLEIRADVGSRIDGTSPTGVPIYTVALDTPDTNPAWLLGQDSDNSVDWIDTDSAIVLLDAAVGGGFVQPFDTLEVTNDASIGGDLDVTGLAGADSLASTGGASIGGNLDVDGDITSPVISTGESLYNIKLGDWDGNSNNVYISVLNNVQRISLDAGQSDLVLYDVDNKIVLTSDSVGIRGDLDVDGNVTVDSVISFAGNVASGEAMSISSIGALSDGEIVVKDGEGNVTIISPHPLEFDGRWMYMSQKDGIYTVVDWEKFITAMEKVTGEKYLYRGSLESIKKELK